MGWATYDSRIDQPGDCRLNKTGYQSEVLEDSLFVHRRGANVVYIRPRLWLTFGLDAQASLSQVPFGGELGGQSGSPKSDEISYACRLAASGARSHSTVQLLGLLSSRLSNL